MAKPDDDFIDITDPSGMSGSPATGKPGEVDFDIVGDGKPPAAADAEPFDHTKTMIIRRPPTPKASADAKPAADKASGPGPGTAPSPAPAAPSARPAASARPAPAPAPASGGAKLWIGIVVAVIVVVVAWWVMRR
ncbi:MAG: hypothetical protein IT514_10170 [Burkholderiales bacterium]|nr:hypothetical protein [Burkholderiales bacterium]